MGEGWRARKAGKHQKMTGSVISNKRLESYGWKAGERER
jgi:hypothetical protein